MRRLAAGLCGVFILTAGLTEVRSEIKPKRIPSWDDLRPIRLKFSHVEFMLKAARAMLEKGTTALPNAGVSDAAMDPLLSERDERWIFLTFFSPGRSPLTVATHKRSLIGSLAGCVQIALDSKEFRSDFADRLDRTQILLDIPVIVVRIWPATVKGITSEFDPSAFGLYVSDGKRHGFVLPAQYFAGRKAPKDFRDSFIKKFRVKGKDFLDRGSSVFMFSLNSHIESSPGGLAVPLVRGKVLRAGASPEMIDARIELAVKFLLAHQRRDGSFFTTFDPRRGIISERNYNVRKHAEVTAALVEYAGATGYPKVCDAADLAVDYLINKCRRGWKGDKRLLYLPDVRGRADLAETATAAAVLAMDAARTGTHDNYPVLESLLDFIVFMQVFNGDFRRYWPQPKRRDDNPPVVSPFLGQAVCALVEGARRFPSKSGYAEAVDRSAGLLLKRPDDFAKSKVPVETAWLLRAMVELSRYYRSRAGGEGRARDLMALAVRLSANLLSRQYTMADADFPDQAGGFRSFGATSNPEDEDLATLSAIDRRLRVEPSALVTAGLLEGISLVAAERATASVPSKRILAGLRNSADFLIREQYDDLNTYYLRRPRSAVGAVRMTVDDATVHIETMALFVRSLLAARKVIKD